VPPATAVTIRGVANFTPLQTSADGAGKYSFANLFVFSVALRCTLLSAIWTVHIKKKTMLSSINTSPLFLAPPIKIFFENQGQPKYAKIKNAPVRDVSPSASAPFLFAAPALYFVVTQESKTRYH
jgi:hypothetical protein